MDIDEIKEIITELYSDTKHSKEVKEQVLQALNTLDEIKYKLVINNLEAD